MNKFQIATHAFLSIACALGIQSKLYAEPANLAQLKTEIRTYHDSGAYQKDLARVTIPATHYIIERAESNAKKPHPRKLAIVLDIDETTLSNYHSIVSRDFADNKKLVHKHLLDADDPAIKPMRSLYQTALKQHVAVFFVTGRGADLKQATIKNLKRSGYPTWSGIYFRPIQYKKSSIAVFKTRTRKIITRQGYTIIASIGDQNSDLTGGYAEKTFKLPNPYYFVP